MERPSTPPKAAFSSALLGWYRRNARVLPWREAPSLYRTVVSEFMLQQTQVRTVLPYFARWMAALPDFAALAAAPELQVLRLWEGLGYYARARNLHRLAQALAARTEVPGSAAAWQELPGIGPYTAAAIASIAGGDRAACVDGNVVRILARLTADGTQFRDSASAARFFAPLANELLSPEKPGDRNQAMMELGATVCLRQNPLCPACPVQSFCAARRLGHPAGFPRLAAKATVRVSVARAWCERGGALLLRRAAPGARRLANLHELPTPEEAGWSPAAASASTLLVRRKRCITKYQITESIHVFGAPRAPLAEGLAWIPLEKLDGIALSGPHRKWVREILTHISASRRTLDSRTSSGVARGPSSSTRVCPGRQNLLTISKSTRPVPTG